MDGPCRKRCASSEKQGCTFIRSLQIGLWYSWFPPRNLTYNTSNIIARDCRMFIIKGLVFRGGKQAMQSIFKQFEHFSTRLDLPALITDAF